MHHCPVHDIEACELRCFVGGCRMVAGPLKRGVTPSVAQMAESSSVETCFGGVPPQEFGRWGPFVWPWE
jgi:hypothetical protein